MVLIFPVLAVCSSLCLAAETEKALKVYSRFEDVSVGSHDYLTAVDSQILL